jgi:hypothetical protein
MSDLRNRAHQKGLKDAVERIGQSVGAAAPQQPLPDIRENGRTADLTAPVGVAWSNVMADVLWVGKEYSTELKYQIRGIDAVLNTVGPVLRKHGVSVVPVSVQPTYTKVQTVGRDGKPRNMNRCEVIVRYSVLGPTGDVLPVTFESAGEAINSGDKATAGAMTVALRTLYINALAIPTNRPEDDPEYTAHELATPPPPTPDEYYRELTQEPSVNRCRQIQAEFRAHPDIATAEYDDVGGVKVTLGALLSRVGNEALERERRRQREQEAPR